MMTHWWLNSFFYQIYPLGCLAAPSHNDFDAKPVARLNELHLWLDHLQSLGVNALYLGPVFESTAHGYDTSDYYRVDRRLGTNEDLARFSRELHSRGMKLILDAVFNHTGRDFWAFKDVRANPASSPYRDWFHDFRIGETSPFGDPFSYTGWNGYYDLVKLNLRNPAVKGHLLGAVDAWIEQFDIDGLRLDAADLLELDFLRTLRSHCDSRKADFWLMGELVHGDYRKWMNQIMLHSATNYECYKGLYSSLVDCNYFEIAYALNRQSGRDGKYRDHLLYNFADNHDVNRVASQLKDPGLLYPLYFLLFSMPGIPSIYYGSEWGLEGERTPHSDAPLRPAINLEQMKKSPPQPDLVRAIQRLAGARSVHPALQNGQYEQILVQHLQLVFSRSLDGHECLVCLNADTNSVSVNLKLEDRSGNVWQDALEDGYQVSENNRILTVEIPGRWGRILVKTG
jgi:glycosidase